MPRKPKTDSDHVILLQETLDSEGWAYGLAVIAEQLQRIRRQVFSLESPDDVISYIKSLRQVRQIFHSVYSAAGIDMPDAFAALFE